MLTCRSARIASILFCSGYCGGLYLLLAGQCSFLCWVCVCSECLWLKASVLVMANLNFVAHEKLQGSWTNTYKTIVSMPGFNVFLQPTARKRSNSVIIFTFFILNCNKQCVERVELHKADVFNCLGTAVI